LSAAVLDELAVGNAASVTLPIGIAALPETLRVAEYLKVGGSLTEALDAYVRRGLDGDAWRGLLELSDPLPNIDTVTS